MFLTSLRALMLGKYNAFEQQLNGERAPRHQCMSLGFDVPENKALSHQVPLGVELNLLCDKTFNDDAEVPRGTWRGAVQCAARAEVCAAFLLSPACKGITER